MGATGTGAAGPDPHQPWAPVRAGLRGVGARPDPGAGVRNEEDADVAGVMGSDPIHAQQVGLWEGSEWRVSL